MSADQCLSNISVRLSSSDLESAFPCTSLSVMVKVVTGARDSGRARGVAGTRVCAQRIILKPHPVHPRGLSSQELTQRHKTLSNAALTPHPIRPLNGCDPLDTHEYLECVRELVHVQAAGFGHARLSYVRKYSPYIQYIPTYRLVWLFICVFKGRFISLPLFHLLTDENIVGSHTHSHTTQPLRYFMSL